VEGLDQRVEALSAARDAASVPARGWLRAVREAIGLSQGRIAERATIKRQSYSQFESAEAKGTISLGSLKRVAEAMDCDLVYYLVPRKPVGTSFSALAAIHDPASAHLRATEHSMALGGQGNAPTQEGAGRLDKP